MKALLAAALVILTTAAHAEPRVANGPGATTCAEYAKRYKDDPAYMKVLYLSWTQGFMTALNVAYVASKSGGYRDVGFISDELQEQNVREYCDKHPLANFSDSAFSLYQSLPLVPVK